MRTTALAALLALAAGASHAADVTVSAAASLTESFKELAALFESSHPGTQVLLNFAASDALVAQIEKGAPVDVFAAADEASMDRAAAGRLLAPGTRHDFAANALVLIVPADAKAPPHSLAGLATPAVRHVAIGQPTTVPAGRYAKAALEAAGLWATVEPKAVFAQNVRQARDYVERGEAEAGLVYATDAAAAAGKVKVAAQVPTPTPIRYPVAAIAAGPDAADGKAFVDFLLTAPAQAVLGRHGFSKP